MMAIEQFRTSSLLKLSFVLDETGGALTAADAVFGSSAPRRLTSAASVHEAQ